MESKRRYTFNFDIFEVYLQNKFAKSVPLTVYDNAKVSMDGQFGKHNNATPHTTPHT